VENLMLSLNITQGSYPNFINRISELARLRYSSYVCVANVHMLVEAHRDERFSLVVNGADIVTPDGMPLVFGLKILKGVEQDRVAGMDLLPDLLQEAEANQLGVFFFGGTEEMLTATRQYIKTNYPSLSAVYSYSPPFRKLTDKEEDDIVGMINNSGAHLVFVALGCPKQEKWMAAMKGRINACMVGIGGALPVMIGMQKRAPSWMQKASLEWLYRLMQEPGRLFKRYFVTNSIFIGLLFKAWAKQGFRKQLPVTANITSQKIS
jgi:N-acetylglucosaminyldiphosphoundecaprenol N-acetyl-beta-D-mannosaminyltransferase